MKTIALAGALLLAAPFTASLQAQNLPDYAGRWYFHADLGPAMVEDVDLEEFLGPVTGVEVEFDPGVQMGLGAGYYFNDYVALEGQMGFLTSQLDRINGAGPVDLNDSSLTQIPMLVNVVFQYPTRVGLVPFAGVGGGFSLSVLDADEITDYQTFLVDGSDTDAVGAYQLFGGLRYELNERMELGLLYRYLATSDAEWDVDLFPFQPSRDIAIDGIEAHSVSVAFRMRF